jgi:hypothetical protein
MSNVIGPFKQEDWDLLLCLKASVKQYKQLGVSKYKKAFDKETKIYNDLVKQYVEAA